jgi:hypothetical protein
MDKLQEIIEFGKSRDQYNWVIPAKKGGLSKCFYAVPFEGCELTIDPKFKTLIITARGYEVELHWGETENWKTTSNDPDDKFTDAIRIRVLDEDCYDEKPVVDWISLPDKGVTDEDYVIDETMQDTGIIKIEGLS